MSKNLWTREEFILALNLYLKLPFGKISSRRSEIIELANLMGRSANSIALRLTNFASCDPYHQARGVKGMIAGQKLCQPIWDEFIYDPDYLLFESEQILAEKQNNTIEVKFSDILVGLENLKGETKTREVKIRVNQNVFRQIVLTNYNTQCAITGIDIPELLFASHIVPWATNEHERLNPENGICLSALYDKAFDKGLIGINLDYDIILSKRLSKEIDKQYFGRHFAPIENTKLKMPVKYFPKTEFLEWHLDNIFNK